MYCRAYQNTARTNYVLYALTGLVLTRDETRPRDETLVDETGLARLAEPVSSVSWVTFWAKKCKKIQKNLSFRVQFRPIYDSFKHFGATSNTIAALWSALMHFEAHWDTLKLSGALWCTLELIWALCSTLELTRALWSILERSVERFSTNE